MSAMSAKAAKFDAVLITGCSSGIGLATARAFHRRGWRVWAGVRRESSLRQLMELGDRLEPGVAETRRRWRPVLCDVANRESVESVFRLVARDPAPLRALVNNAGYGQFGALEDLTEDEFRRQWEVNVAGAWRTIQLALPLLRASGTRATIVNVSSILGRVALPFGGPYAASKFALEALSDSLRVEVGRWGIRVVVVEPGPIRTRFNQNAREALDFSRAEGSAYEDVYCRLEQYYGRQRRMGELPPSAVVRVIVRAVESPRPPTRVLVTWTAKALALARVFLPDRVIDALLRKYMGL